MRSEMTAPSIALVAGEPSGDRLGAGLINALKARDPKIRFFGMAGTRMIDAGCEAIAHIEELSVMGLSEVARSYFRLRRLRARLGDEILKRRPDVVIGIDVPDFNFGLERRLKKSGVITAHYVCPQAWAWRKGRAKQMPEIADLWLALLPFEPAFFSRFGVATEFVGHPLADEIPLQPDQVKARERLGLDPGRPVLALLPGSRKQEISRLLPIFARTARAVAAARQGLQLVAGLASDTHRELLPPHFAADEITVACEASTDVLTSADVAIVASGTVTLEALFCRTPAVVAYRLAPLSYHIIRHMVEVKNIALSNIVAGHELVPELVQSQVTEASLIEAVNGWLDDPHKTRQYRSEAQRIHEDMRRDASGEAAQCIMRLINGAD